MTTYTLSCFIVVCTVVSSFAARDVPYSSRLSPRYSIRGDACKSVKYLSNSGGKGTTYLDASRLSTTPLPWPRLQYIEGSSRAFSTRTMEALAVRGGNTDSEDDERLSPRRRRGLFLLTYLAYIAIYLARKPISVVKPVLHEELGMSTHQLGDIDASLLGAYAVGQLLIGQVSTKTTSALPHAVNPRR